MIQFMYKLLIYVGHLSPVISIVAPRSKYCGNLHYLLLYVCTSVETFLEVRFTCDLRVEARIILC